MQRVASGVWVGFCPPREACPYSSEDDVDEYGGEEHQTGAWDKGLGEGFGRIVTIVDRTTVSASPPSPSSGLTLTLEGADDDNGVALLTDAQIREGCAFLRTVTDTTTPPPRYSSFPPSPPPPAYSPRGSTKERVLILAPRTRAVDALSLATAYVVARGWKGAGSVHTHTPPRTPTSSSSSHSFTKPLLPDTTFSALTPSMSCADTRTRLKEESHCEATTTPPTGNDVNPNSNSDLAREDAQEDVDADRDLELDLTHPIAEWSARVIPLPPLPLQPEEEEGYTPVHALLMRLHDWDWGGVVGGDEEEGEEGEEGGLRDEWRGVLSWEGMCRVWEVVRGLGGGGSVII